MNALDVLIIVAVVAGAGIGFLQGVVRQAITLIVFYLATVLASQYYTVVGGWLGWIIPADLSPRASIGFILIMVWGILFLGWIANRVYPATKILAFGTADNVAGAVLGLIGAAVFVCVFTTGLRFAVAYPWPSYEVYRVALDGLAHTSRLLPMVTTYAPIIYSTLTPWFPSGVPAILAL